MTLRRAFVVAALALGGEGRAAVLPLPRAASPTRTLDPSRDDVPPPGLTVYDIASR